MNNKGFTLVELLATIAILSVIAVISFVSINGVVEGSKINDCENLLVSIKNATADYFSDNRYSLNNISSYMVSGDDKRYMIDGNVLVNENYLSGIIKNPFLNSEDITSDVKIEVSLKSDYTVLNIEVKNSSGSIVNCSDKSW